MKDLLLDDSGDLALSNRDLAVTSTVREYVAQSIKQKLRTFLGEWFLNTAIGIPYFQSILTKGFDLRVIQTINVQEISSVIGLKELTYYNHSVSNRELNIEIEVTTDENETIALSETI